jgi:uncharacterized protein with HEPN domain
MSPRSTRGDRIRLEDIVEAATANGDHLEAISRDPLIEDIVMDAIKYNLVAIGEAASHISPELQAEHPDIDWPAIRGLRTILTHEYFRVDSQRVRAIAETHVTDLLWRVTDILTRH